MKLLFRQQALLVLTGLVIFFAGIGSYALFNNGEATMAAGAAAMFRTRVWLIPTFNDIVQFDHPILADWLMLISFSVFGINEFAARWPSSVLALGTTLLIYHLGRKLYSPAVGFLAGIVFCTSLAISAYGRAATPDFTQLFFETLAMTCYVWVVAWQRGGNFNDIPSEQTQTESETETEAETGSETNVPQTGETNDAKGEEVTSTARPRLTRWAVARWPLAVPMFVAMGLATLASGITGFAMPCATIVLFLLITFRNEDLNQETLKVPSGQWWRRWIRTVGQLFRPRAILDVILSLHLAMGLGIVVAIAAPWYVWIGLHTNGVWPQEYLWNRSVKSIIELRENFIWLPFFALYDLLVFVAWFFPWAVFLPLALDQLQVRLADEEAQWSDSDLLLACWYGVWSVDFLLFGTDLQNSILRICPAIALILARFLYDWEREEGDILSYAFNQCCKALGACSAVMILAFYLAAYLYFSGEEWLGLIGAVPLIAAYVAIKFLDGDHRRKVVQTIVVCAVVTSILIVALAPRRIERYQDSPQFVADARRIAASEDIQLATYEYFEPSIVFYAGKNVRRLNTPLEVANFISSRPHAFVITRANKHNELRDELQTNVEELSRRRNFLGRQELILLGHR